MRLLFPLLMAIAGIAASVPVAEAQTQIRAAVLKIGTVNWELDTITRNGFDRANGFALEVQPFADNGATRVAFEGGTADLAVVDWLWAARQRAEGKDYVFIPYSRAVGGIVVPSDSPAQNLADLAGAKIGIAGGPLDKSWLILRAYAQQAHGMDLKAQSEQVFGAPPLIYKTALGGDLGAAINFWHFLAKMKAEGMRELVSVQEAAQALGLDPETPLLGYVMKESFLADNPGIVRAFYRASRSAKDLLAGDDAAWEPLRDRMRAGNEAQYQALVADFRAGIPAAGNIDQAAAGRFLALMADLGGAALVGRAETIPDGLFIDLE